MARVRIAVDIEAPLDEVWRAAADLASHAEWMADAESIEFLTPQRYGVGTEMKVATAVGPLRTNDLMTVTEWVDHRSIGVEHSGIVKGRGRFELSPVAGATRFSWTEDLTFPLYLGGPVTAVFSKPVLAWVWKRNLAGLKRRVERPVSAP
jgi:carbon monoxide dehydrogenase subunit G